MRIAHVVRGRCPLFVCLTLLILAVALPPAHAQLDLEAQVPCVDTLPPRMVVGQYGRVTFTDGSTTRLWNYPQGDPLDELPEGTLFRVLETHSCTLGRRGGVLSWWPVEMLDGLRGWLTEGYADGDYWIEPVELARDAGDISLARIGEAAAAGLDWALLNGPALRTPFNRMLFVFEAGRATAARFSLVCARTGSAPHRSARLPVDFNAAQAVVAGDIACGWAEPDADLQQDEVFVLTPITVADDGYVSQPVEGLLALMDELYWRQAVQCALRPGTDYCEGRG